VLLAKNLKQPTYFEITADYIPWYKTKGEQRCWVRKTANVLNQMPKSLQARAKGRPPDPVASTCPCRCIPPPARAGRKSRARDRGLLRHHPPGQPQGTAEGVFQGLVAPGLAADIADGAAKTGFQLPQLPFGLFVLFGMGVSLMLDQRALADRNHWRQSIGHRPHSRYPHSNIANRMF
jgi:hypothetical protein